MQSIIKWFRLTATRIITSIAFLPRVIAVLFLFLSFTMISFDFSEAGKQLKSNLHWLSLKDASTARSICSTLAGGIISLAVFRFSMVMILLNQTASRRSNRILSKLIGSRFQQIILGFYIGTIVYALFLLSTIRDTNPGIYVPAMSTYLLIAPTIFDIFLFIYFLNDVAETVKYETIINDGTAVLGLHKPGDLMAFRLSILLSWCSKTAGTKKRFGLGRNHLKRFSRSISVPSGTMEKMIA